MADYKDRWEDNSSTPSKVGNIKYEFYCDSACISCAVCRENAPNNFKLSDISNHSICFKQPENVKELEECEEALICCPVSAIGKVEYGNVQEGTEKEKKEESIKSYY
tara:strand:- start:490 stop:810 length:321 start_codon:yes stop_codon:yes gene_type:complete